MQKVKTKNYRKKQKQVHKSRYKKEQPMECNRRAEQGERGRRRACVLKALPCSRLQHKVLQYPADSKTIIMHALKILKTHRHELSQI